MCNTTTISSSRYAAYLPGQSLEVPQKAVRAWMHACVMSSSGCAHMRCCVDLAGDRAITLITGPIGCAVCCCCCCAVGSTRGRSRSPQSIPELTAGERQHKVMFDTGRCRCRYFSFRFRRQDQQITRRIYRRSLPIYYSDDCRKDFFPSCSGRERRTDRQTDPCSTHCPSLGASGDFSAGLRRSIHP